MRSDRITANLPSRDFDATEAFYASLGFVTGFKDDGWMILHRDGMVVEFFPHPNLDPKSSWFSACMRVDDLDDLHASFQSANLPSDPRSIPRMTPPEDIAPGVRMFALVDADGSLWRCLQNEAA